MLEISLLEGGSNMPTVQLTEEEIRRLIAGLGELCAINQNDVGEVAACQDLMEKLFKLKADE